MDQNENKFFCPFDKTPLSEQRLGFLYCEKCFSWFLISWINETRFNMQEVWKGSIE